METMGIKVTPYITNQSLGDLKFLEKIDWNGCVDEDGYPDVPYAGNTSFTHQATTENDGKGSKGAVVYTGTTRGAGEANAAWLFAWSVHRNGTNQVYAETGPISKYAKGNINWDEIQTKLDNSEDTTCIFTDEDTKAEVYADIGDGKGIMLPVICKVAT